MFIFDQYSPDYHGDHFDLDNFNDYIVHSLNSLLEQSDDWYELQNVVNQFKRLDKNKAIVYNTYLVDNIKMLNDLITMDSCIQHNITDDKLIKRVTTILQFCVASNVRSE